MLKIFENDGELILLTIVLLAFMFLAGYLFVNDMNNDWNFKSNCIAADMQYEDGDCVK